MQGPGKRGYGQVVGRMVVILSQHPDAPVVTKPTSITSVWPITLPRPIRASRRSQVEALTGFE